MDLKKHLAYGLLGFLVLLVVSLTTNYLLWYFGFWNDSDSSVGHTQFIESPIFIGFQIILLGPVTEEYLFRGPILLLIKGGARYFLKIFASVIISTLWGLTHVLNYENPLCGRAIGMVISCTISGVLFSWIVIKTRSLLATIIGHALFDSLVVILWLTQ